MSLASYPPSWMARRSSVHSLHVVSATFSIGQNEFCPTRRTSTRCQERISSAVGNTTRCITSLTNDLSPVTGSNRVLSSGNIAYILASVSRRICSITSMHSPRCLNLYKRCENRLAEPVTSSSHGYAKYPWVMCM